MAGFLYALIGAIVGGGFALAGTFLQGQIQARRQQKRFEQERNLAVEDHARKVVAEENDRLRELIQLQLDFGQKAARLAARFQAFTRNARGVDRTRVLFDAFDFVGIDPNTTAPWGGWLSRSEVHDQRLSDLLALHDSIVRPLFLNLMLADHPEKQRHDQRLPDDCLRVVEELSDLARKIRVRMRELQRTGNPY